MSSYSYHIAILNENICFTGFLIFFFFAHKKIKIFRVGGKNRVGRVTPIKQFFFLGLSNKKVRNYFFFLKFFSWPWQPVQTYLITNINIWLTLMKTRHIVHRGNSFISYWNTWNALHFFSQLHEILSMFIECIRTIIWLFFLPINHVNSTLFFLWPLCRIDINIWNGLDFKKIVGGCRGGGGTCMSEVYRYVPLLTTPFSGGDPPFYT